MFLFNFMLLYNKLHFFVPAFENDKCILQIPFRTWNFKQHRERSVLWKIDTVTSKNFHTPEKNLKNQQIYITILNRFIIPKYSLSIFRNIKLYLLFGHRLKMNVYLNVF